MTYTCMRTPLTRGAKRTVKQKDIDIQRDVSEEVALAWIKANLQTSAWIYVQDNEKSFNGKDNR